MHPQFFEIAKSGRHYTRQMVIDYMSSLQQAPVARSFDHTLRLCSAQGVWLTYQSEHTEQGSIVHCFRSSLWCPNDAGWQIVFHQATILQGEA